MRTMLLDQPGGPLRYAEVATPAPPPGQALLRVHACAICRTDPHNIGGDLRADVRLAPFDEGLCAQIMYRGPYADEGPTIASPHAYINEQGYVLAGRHHETYLSDPRRAAPQPMRTIIRQPIRRA